jgi:hypothetical protein
VTTARGRPSAWRPPLPRVWLVAGLVILVLGLLRAGSSDRLSKLEYEQVVRSNFTEVQQAFRATRVDRPEDLPPRVEAAQDQLRGAAERLAWIEPPENVESEHEALVDGMREYVRDLDVLREAAERGDAGAVRRFNAAIARNHGIAQMAGAVRGLEHKGYDIGVGD